MASGGSNLDDLFSENQLTFFAQFTKSYYNAWKVHMFVCLSYTSGPLAPCVLHGRRPRPRRLSPWALSTCASTMSFNSPTSSQRGLSLLVQINCGLKFWNHKSLGSTDPTSPHKWRPLWTNSSMTNDAVRYYVFYMFLPAKIQPQNCDYAKLSLRETWSSLMYRPSIFKLWPSLKR